MGAPVPPRPPRPPARPSGWAPGWPPGRPGSRAGTGRRRLAVGLLALALVNLGLAAIDLMGFDQFGGKMVGLVGVAGGAMGALSALASLRTIGRSLHAWVVPEQAMIPHAWKVFDAEGNLNDASFEKRLRNVGAQVARFAFLHNSEQALDFLRLWEGAPVNPGGD